MPERAATEALSKRSAAPTAMTANAVSGSTRIPASARTDRTTAERPRSASAADPPAVTPRVSCAWRRSRSVSRRASSTTLARGSGATLALGRGSAATSGGDGDSMIAMVFSFVARKLVCSSHAARRERRRGVAWTPAGARARASHTPLEDGAARNASRDVGRSRAALSISSSALVEKREANDRERTRASGIRRASAALR